MECELRWGIGAQVGNRSSGGKSRVGGIEGVYCGLEPFAMKLEFKMMRIRCFLTRAREAQTTAFVHSSQNIHTCHFGTNASAIVLVADLTPKSS